MNGYFLLQKPKLHPDSEELDVFLQKCFFVEMPKNVFFSTKKVEKQALNYIEDHDPSPNEALLWRILRNCYC